MKPPDGIDTTPGTLLWTIKQTARALGLSVPTLYAWVNQRKIVFVKAGGRVLFDPGDIREWIESRKVRPPTSN